MFEFNDLPTQMELPNSSNDNSNSNMENLGASFLMNNKSGAEPPKTDSIFDNIGSMESDLEILKTNTNDNLRAPVSSSLGADTMRLDQNNNNNSWDGYNNSTAHISSTIPDDIFSSKMDAERHNMEEMDHETHMRDKFNILQKIKKLSRKKGVEFSKTYTDSSNYMEMKSEYDAINGELEKKKSIESYGKLLISSMNIMESFNSAVNPIGADLDGIADKFEENIDDLEDEFGELHDLYSGNINIRPEFRLAGKIAMTCFMVHTTNSMMKSMMPNMENVLKQDPNLMNSFQNATMNTMAAENPEMSGFINNMNTPGKPNAQPNRGNNNYQSQHKSHPPVEPTTRPEMAGPKDISELLGTVGTIVEEGTTNTSTPKPVESLNEIDEDVSVVTSIVSISDLQKPRRKNKKKKATVNLDL